MSTATVKLQYNALASVTPVFMITRGITETHSITLLNQTGTALSTTGILSWTFQIAHDFLISTGILAESTSITASANILSAIVLNAHTTELAAFMEGKALEPLYGTLIGFNGSAAAVKVITFRIVCANSVYDPESSPTPAIISGYYTKAQVDAKFADIAGTLTIPTDINELDDEDGLLFSGSYNDLTDKPTIPEDVSDLTDNSGLLFDGDYDSLSNKPTIPADLSSLTDTTNILPGKVDKVTGYGLSKNDYTDAAVAKVATIQLETLNELTGTEVSVAPWTQSVWSASGVCSLTASGFAVSGHQVAYVLITLAAEATLSVSGATVADDDALGAAGTYACYLINENGTVRFKVAGFTEAA